MEKQRRLLFARNVFLFIIFVCFGVIIVTEKASGLLIPRVEKKMKEYLNTNYQDILSDIKTSAVVYDKTIYRMKVTSEENKDLFFYIYYSEKKLSDTYQKDYIEGNRLLTRIKKDLENDIRKKINTSVKVDALASLDKYTTRVKDRIIKEDNLLELKFYTVEKEIPISNWNSKVINQSIVDFIKKFKDNNITPKSYKLIITNSKDVTEAIEISNITEDFITNKDNEKIIKDILADNNSKLVKDNNIKYKYLNEEE